MAMLCLTTAAAGRPACEDGIEALLPAPLTTDDLAAATARSYAASVYDSCRAAYDEALAANPVPTAWVLQKVMPDVWPVASPALDLETGSCRPAVVTTCAVSEQYDGCDTDICTSTCVRDGLQDRPRQT
jgi:hypothetical protein